MEEDSHQFRGMYVTKSFSLPMDESSAFLWFNGIGGSTGPQPCCGPVFLQAVFRPWLPFTGVQPAILACKTYALTERCNTTLVRLSNVRFLREGAWWHSWCDEKYLKIKISEGFYEKYSF
ncbi:MAG: hypothetical protein Q9M25_04485 [Mariprofundaceae bacterium]|nr:hypothetical protein [Mariprofundaceae bacterium]